MEDYKKALAAARTEYEKLLEAREEMDIRLTQLKQTIVALAALCKDRRFLLEWATDVQAAGLTENCREILKAASRPLTPLDVKAELLKMGLDANQYTNLLASIHSVLKRLVEAHDAAPVALEDGSPAYNWRKRRQFTFTETKVAIPKEYADMWKEIDAALAPSRAEAEKLNAQIRAAMAPLTEPMEHLRATITPVADEIARLRSGILGDSKDGRIILKDVEKPKKRFGKKG